MFPRKQETQPLWLPSRLQIFPSSDYERAVVVVGGIRQIVSFSPENVNKSNFGAAQGMFPEKVRGRGSRGDAR